MYHHAFILTSPRETSYVVIFKDINSMIL